MLPPLPPLTAPKCDACKLRGSTRYVDTTVGSFKLCDVCEAPDVLPVAAMGRLPTLPALPSLGPLFAAKVLKGAVSLAPLSAPKAAAKDWLQPLHSLTARVQADAALYAGCPPARILVADPPWKFGDSTPHKGADDHYRTMSLDEIKAFPLPPLADDAILFMWRVAGGSDAAGSFGEQAYSVMRAWGFTPKSELCWQKINTCKVCGGNGYGPLPHPPPGMEAALSEIRVWCDNCKGRGYKNSIGMGRYVRGAHEVCLIGTRGKPQFPDDKGVCSVFRAPRGAHSAKPELFYDLVEQLYETGPYVELFARRRRPDWHCFGDELPPTDAENSLT